MNRRRSRERKREKDEAVECMLNLLFRMTD